MLCLCCRAPQLAPRCQPVSAVRVVVVLRDVKCVSNRLPHVSGNRRCVTLCETTVGLECRVRVRVGVPRGEGVRVRVRVLKLVLDCRTVRPPSQMEDCC